jgi:hypothetical protein
MVRERGEQYLVVMLSSEDGEREREGTVPPGKALK